MTENVEISENLRLKKFYPGMEYRTVRSEYVITKAAWISAEYLEQKGFNVDEIYEPWTHSGETGEVRKINDRYKYTLS